MWTYAEFCTVAALACLVIDEGMPQVVDFDPLRFHTAIIQSEMEGIPMDIYINVEA